MKAPRLAIVQLEHEEKEALEEAARATKLKRQQDRVVCRMKGLIILSHSDFDDCDDQSSTSSSDDQYPPPATDAHTCIDDRKGKESMRK
ncbi:Bifunctional dihydroflavonol 4-reductase/flavanone 4-reductase [Hordeum vulgare]|nr:Bifunctional dihydroflavonol 4-reductase/flavanone 4-reductase [Hordeum vulgare]